MIVFDGSVLEECHAGTGIFVELGKIADKRRSAFRDDNKDDEPVFVGSGKRLILTLKLPMNPPGKGWAID